MRQFTLIVIVFLLVGCQTTQRVTPETVLQENHGIVASEFSCGSGVFWAEVFASGVPLPNSITSQMAPYANGRSAVMYCQDEEMEFIELPAGDYYFGRVAQSRGELMFPEDSAVKFSVKPRFINYIGHIHVRTKKEYSSSRVTVKVAPPRITDQSKEAKEYLSEKYPSVVERYDFITNLAQ